MGAIADGEGSDPFADGEGSDPRVCLRVQAALAAHAPYRTSASAAAAEMDAFMYSSASKGIVRQALSTSPPYLPHLFFRHVRVGDYLRRYAEGDREAVSRRCPALLAAPWR